MSTSWPRYHECFGGQRSAIANPPAVKVAVGVLLVKGCQCEHIFSAKAMTDKPVPTKAIRQIIAEGRALVQAIAVIDTSAPTDRFERQKTRLRQVEYRHRLREILRGVPTWVTEEILNTSQYIEEDKGGDGV